MKCLTNLVFACLLLSGLALAEPYTNVTGIARDSQGHVYQNCTYSVQFVGQASQGGPYLFLGSIFQQNYPGARCDGFGNLAIRLPSNPSISPQPSSWEFNICDSSGHFCNAPGSAVITISGNTQDITTQLTAVLPILPTTGGGAVSSVFGRTGAVTAQVGDYNVSMVTGSAPLLSPNFTGTPTGPTAAVGTNTGQLATTAFVLANGGTGGGGGINAGTVNALAQYNTASTLGPSLASDDGTTFTYAGTGGINANQVFSTLTGGFQIESATAPLPALPGVGQNALVSGPDAWYFSNNNSAYAKLGTGGGGPTGPAGGDLSGTYPNPTVAQINGSAIPTGTSGTGATVIGTNSAGQLVDSSSLVAPALSASSTQLLYNNAGTATGTPSLTWNVSNVAPQLALGSLTNDINPFPITWTTNASGTTFGGLKFIATNTAQNTGTLNYQFCGGSAGTSCVTIDPSGNIATPGTITAGLGSATAGYVPMVNGTANTITANSVGFEAPLNVTTGFKYVLPPSEPTANAPLLVTAASSHSANIVHGTFSGNTTTVATVTGTNASGDAAGFDANGNIVDIGPPATGGITPIYKTQSASTNTNIATTTMVASTSAMHDYLFAWTVSQTVAGVGCTGTTTVALNIIFEDPNTVALSAMTLGVITIAAGSNGLLGVSGTGVDNILAKAASAVQYSTTNYTAGAGCTTNPSYQVSPTLVQLW